MTEKSENEIITMPAEAVDIMKSLRETVAGNKHALTQLDTLEMMMFSNLRLSSEILFEVRKINNNLEKSRLPGLTSSNNGKSVKLTTKSDKTIASSSLFKTDSSQTDGPKSK